MSEKPEPQELQANTDETYLAFLQEANSAARPEYAALSTGCEAPESADDKQKFDLLPRDKIPPTENKEYHPANPPQPEHVVDRSQIKQRDPKDKSQGSFYQNTGKIDGYKDMECTVTSVWETDTKLEGQKNLPATEVAYRNKAADATQSGIDISFMYADSAVGKNTRTVRGGPINDVERERFGLDYEIEAYPVRDKDGDYLVYATKVFVKPDLNIEDKTIDTIGGTVDNLDDRIDYKHLYSTQILRYAGVDKDGNPIGLKSASLYADEDGGTKRKIMDVSYLDDKKQPTLDGKPTSSTVYDPDTGITDPATRVTLRAVDHTQFKGATVTAKVTEPDYLKPKYERISDVDLEDQNCTTVTYYRPDKSIEYEVIRNPVDKTSLTVVLNDSVNLGSFEGKTFAPGSAVVEFKQDSKQNYYISHMKLSEGNRLISDIDTPSGELKLKYDGTKVVGVEGAKFYYSNGTEIPQAIIAKIFAERSDVHDSWVKLVNGKTKKVAVKN